MTESLADLIARGASRAQNNIRKGKTKPASEGPKERPAEPVVAKALPPAPGEPPLANPPKVRGANGSSRKALVAMQRDERYRVFARELFFSGFDHEKAYRVAGYQCKKKHIRGHISNLMKQLVVQDELARLGQVAREVLNAKTIDVTAFWKEICDANIFDYIQQREDGTISVAPGLKELPKEKQRAIKRIKVTQTTYTDKQGNETETIVTDIELWDRIAALRNVGEIQKLYDGPRDVLEDFAAILADRLTKAQRRVGQTFDESGRVVSG